jgi:hypothetical protein
MLAPSSRWIVRACALTIALGAGVMAGCPFQLERGFSCGDGWWDPEFEECDPADPQRAYAGACRDLELGFPADAACDPQTCTIVATPESCNECGDGIAFGDDEECDGEDLRGNVCMAGSGSLRCTSDCKIDYSDCPAFCGDDIVNGTEECEAAVLCNDDSDCSDDRVCFQGNCVSPGDRFAPLSACSNYETTAVMMDKPYASGTVSGCIGQLCRFGRNNCSFCGDGELDPEYTDVIAPGGTYEFKAEICDGEEAVLEELEAHCEPLCVDDPINSDVVVLCAAECAADCQGFATPGDVVPPVPESLGCCVAEDSPCPKFGLDGVPDLPCCSWLENPDWLEEEKCVASQTGQIPVNFVCP